MAEEEQDATRRRNRRAGRGRSRRRRGSDDTVLITSAKKSRLSNWRHRRHVYAALQLSRIPLFIIAVMIYGWLHNPALAALVAVISLPLPWVAVLLANDAGEAQEKGVPKVYKPALVREQRARETQALADPTSRAALGSAPDTPQTGVRRDTPEIIDADEENPHR
jgi:hypothetical protein